MQLLDWPHDTNLMRYENYSVVTEEIMVHALRSFASLFAQGIIYFMNSMGTEDDEYSRSHVFHNMFKNCLLQRCYINYGSTSLFFMTYQFRRV